MAGIAKRIARELIFPLAAKIPSGLLSKIFSFPNGIVVMFHGVTKADYSWLNGRHMVEEDFEKMISYFKKNFTIQTTDQYFSNQPAKNGKPNMLLTFDDGFKNNLWSAKPILEKYEAPAVVFMTSIGLEEQDALLWADMVEVITYDQTSVNFNGDIFIKSKSGWQNAKGTHLHQVIKKLEPSKRDLALNQLGIDNNIIDRKHRIAREAWALMDSNELKQLGNSGLIEVGSHSHQHYNLANISLEMAKEEIVRSKDIIEATTGKSVLSIAFPDGSYNAAIKKICREVGYKYLFAVNYNSDSHLDDKLDATIRSRFGISNTTTPESNILKMFREAKSLAN